MFENTVFINETVRIPSAQNRVQLYIDSYLKLLHIDHKQLSLGSTSNMCGILSVSE